MLRRWLILAALSLAAVAPSHATTLWPELKAYDFCRAYYIEDGGVVVVPQDGFYCPGAVKTPEGLRVAPGQTFTQFDPARHIVEHYKLLRVDANDHRAYFHERRYHYKFVRTEQNTWRFVQQDYIDSDDFYLTHWRALEWFDGAIPDVEIHPGEQLWRTRP